MRLEVWKGFEYRPTSLTTQVSAGRMRRVELTLEKTTAMSDAGYWSCDPHIHIQRVDDVDEKRILDLLEAEDIHFGTTLAYNEPTGHYAGFAAVPFHAAIRFSVLAERPGKRSC